ncbi:MAG: beta-lactamase family protein, partial [Acidobacteria bacterium]|nr:beta-lactamase family protein [Acidobacteriota bacterium]
MTHTLRGWLSACVLAGILTAAEPAVLREGPSESAGVSDGRLASALSRVQEWTDAGVIAGAVALIARNGVIVAHHANGWADIEKKLQFAPDTICQLASVTKPVTATAVMVLVEESRLALDDPVGKHIPAFQRHPKVTLRHLLTHTSGLPRDVPSRKTPPAMHQGWLARRLADIA